MMTGTFLAVREQFLDHLQRLRSILGNLDQW